MKKKKNIAFDTLNMIDLFELSEVEEKKAAYKFKASLLELPCITLDKAGYDNVFLNKEEITNYIYKTGNTNKKKLQND